LFCPVNNRHATCVLLWSAATSSSIISSRLKLGCALGRTTMWLAEMFSHVFAADISAARLKAAQEALREQGRTNVSFLPSDDIASYESLPRFDVFFSIIVLEHNPPLLITHILRTLLRKPNPSMSRIFSGAYLSRRLSF
jgi:2-polyprenyl-3-methyl-5-hydroxy-6-metoxy-1,4-benzoquinol methylase